MTTRPLLLVAASGLAREAMEAVVASGVGHVVGVLDDAPERWGTRAGGVGVLGPPEIAIEHPEAGIVLCPGRGHARQRLHDRLSALGVPDQRYETVVHPAATVARSAVLGHGCVLLAGAVLTADVRLGDHVVVMPHAVLTHDDVVESYATLCASVALAGGVHVGRAAYLGAGATVRERLTVGDGSTLGMGAVAITDIPPNEVWAGNPARRLRAPLPASLSVTTGTAG